MIEPMTDPGPSVQVQVLVVGAGPTGLTLAHELARRGVPFRLVDRAEAPSPLSRALGIHARTLEVFDLMGVTEPFLRAGLSLRGAQLHFGPEPGRIAEIGLDRLPSRHPCVLCLPQSETEAFLAAALARRGHGPEWGTALEDFLEDGGGVTARLRRADGTTETVRARWIVGCDGAHSATRKALGLDFAGRAYPEQFVLADVSLACVEGTIDPSCLHVFPSPGGLLALFPLPGNTFRIVLSMPEALPEGEPALEKIQALVDARLAGTGVALRLFDPRWRAAFRIHHRIVPRLRSPGGRVFLAGDAAHIHSPAGGQGMNTGIQDAFNLAWKLARAAQGGPASLLDSYEAERHPVDAGVVRDTDALTRLVSLRSAPLRFVRDRLFPVLARLPLIRKRAALRLSQLAVAYRRSPLSFEHALPGGPRAGERAPDVTLPGGLPLHSLFQAGGPVALTLLPPSPSREQEARAEQLESLVQGRFGARQAAARLALGNEGAARYGSAPAFYLLRPDGYVGFRSPLGKAGERLPAYLDRL